MSGARATSVLDSNAGEEADRLYRELIDAAAEGRQDKLIANGGPEHAAYLMQRFLELGQSKVRLCTGRLARAFRGVAMYSRDDIIRAAKAFLSQADTEFAILIQVKMDLDRGEEPQNHPLIRALLEDEARQGQLNVYQMTESGFKYEFAVLDDWAFRVETDTKQAEAIANFGHHSLAQDLASLFDNLVEGHSKTLVAA